MRTFGVMYDHTFSKLANHQIRHQATHKVGCQPGACIWSFQYSSGVCVGMYGLTYSRITPEETVYLCCSIWWCGWGCLHGYVLINMMSWNSISNVYHHKWGNGGGAVCRFLTVFTDVSNIIYEAQPQLGEKPLTSLAMISNPPCRFPQNTSLSLPGPRLQFQRSVHPAKQNRHYYEVTDGSVVNTSISGTWKFVVNTLVS